jgi:hypothetical protein
MPTVLACPDPTCHAPAWIIDRWVFASTDGPVEHVKISCASGHVLTPLAESLAVPRAGSAAAWASGPIVPVGRRRAAGSPTPSRAT